ncbi:MAG: I78 family peptidase inhibitor [Stenotrophomonas sp.]
MTCMLAGAGIHIVGAFFLAEVSNMRLPFTVVATSLLALAGCTTAAPPVASQPSAPIAKPIDGGMQCQPQTLATFVGQSATDAVVTQALAASGARTARVAKPDMPMTMDFRQDRLTIVVDAQNRIVQLNCG